MDPVACSRCYRTFDLELWTLTPDNHRYRTCDPCRNKHIVKRTDEAGVGQGQDQLPINRRRQRSRSPTCDQPSSRSRSRPREIQDEVEGGGGGQSPSHDHTNPTPLRLPPFRHGQQPPSQQDVQDTHRILADLANALTSMKLHECSVCEESSICMRG